MLLKFHVNLYYLQGVGKWIAKLSETELNLSKSRIIVGDLEKQQGHQPNNINQ